MAMRDKSSRERYIVDCPACLGTGKVSHPGSTVLHGCRLCWERGVVSTIIADRWLGRMETEDGVR